ncbi:MAG: 1-acyl-sn-glycerol-3-phosphate acyltransferase [Candidatus Omnitrophica bacterium]|nr:1-acyl-sn-glycerol-3-phosphate acyltransferase [Candidatus Omnitrophota bacterium]
MEAILSVIAWIGIGLSTMGWTILIGLLYLVHPWIDPERKRVHSLAGFWGRGLVSMAPGCRVQVFGQEQIPRGGPVIFMANHQSYVDVPALYFLRRQFKWMADVELFRIPVFGWAMRMAGYIPVRRGDRKAALLSMGQAKQWLSEGISIFVFPEGTRSHTGLFGRFQTGGFRLAVTTGTPIVPVVLVGTRQLLPRGTWIFRLGGRLKIHLLAPVVLVSSDPAQVHPLAKKVRRQMMSVYREHLREYNPQR